MNGSCPAVTIIIPIFNTSRYLYKCLDSVYNQTFIDFEVLMIDDGSTDESGSIAREFASNDSRFKYYHQENSGVSAARNFGLDKAVGKSVIFVDSDDYLETNMLEVLIGNMKKTQADISCCQYDHFPPKDIEQLEIWSCRQSLLEFLVHRRINGSLVNKLIDREMINQNRFMTEIRYGEDALFFWRVLQSVNTVCMTNKVLYHVVHHDDSTSGAGYFKTAMMDGIKVWSVIAKEAELLSRSLRIEARARNGHMAFFTWYAMVIYDYHNANYSARLKECIRKSLPDMLHSGNVRADVKLLSLVVLLNEPLARMMVHIKQQ